MLPNPEMIINSLEEIDANIKPGNIVYFEEKENVFSVLPKMRIICYGPFNDKTVKEEIADWLNQNPGKKWGSYTTAPTKQSARMAFYYIWLDKRFKNFPPEGTSRY